MKATLGVSLTQDRYGVRVASCIEIDGPFLEAFEPIDRVDDPLVAAIVGGTTAIAGMRVTKMRAHYAKILADQLALEIMELMASRDKRDGYTKAELCGDRGE